MKSFVKHIAFLGFGIALVATGYTQASIFSQHTANKRSVQQYVPKREMTEVDLLLQLNKEERAVYKSLDPATKRQVLELASQSYRWTKGGADKGLSIELALRQQNEQKRKTDIDLLHNGMNRATVHNKGRHNHN